MPRDASGNYTLPPSNPVVDGQIIDVNWANPTMNDIALQLNGTMTRDGLLGPSGPFKTIDGTVGAPSLTFTSETGLGWYRPAAGQIGFATSGARALLFDFSNNANSAQYLYPRVAGGSTFVLFANPSLNADKSGLSLKGDNVKATLTSFGSNGTTDRKQFSFEASQFDWTATVGAAIGVMSFLSDGTFTVPSAVATVSSVAPTLKLTMAAQADLDRPTWKQSAGFVDHMFNKDWGFNWNRTNGLLKYIRPVHPPTVWDALGNFYAGRDISCGSWDGVASLTNANYPRMVSSPQTTPHRPAIYWSVEDYKLMFDWVSGSAATFGFYSFDGSPKMVADMIGGNFEIAGPIATKSAGTTWANPSDRRLKHDIEDYDEGLEQVIAIRPRKFKYNATPDQEHVGIVADEIQPILPRTISKDKNGFSLFHADAVTWALVNSVKNLNERLRQLEAHPA